LYTLSDQPLKGDHADDKQYNNDSEDEYNRSRNCCNRHILFYTHLLQKPAVRVSLRAIDKTAVGFNLRNTHPIFYIHYRVVTGGADVVADPIPHQPVQTHLSHNSPPITLAFHGDCPRAISCGGSPGVTLLLNTLLFTRLEKYL